MTALKGKTALVTGAARGIGRALTVALAGEGCRVAAADMNEKDLRLLKKELNSNLIFVYELDVTKPASISACARKIKKEIGPIDIIVNNAGIVFGGPFHTTPLEKHIKTFAVNVDGLVAVTHQFLPDLIEKNSGHIVNMASASGLVSLPYGTTYAASKWAVIGFSDSLRMELKMNKFEIPVTCVCPSYVNTGMFDGVKPPILTPLLTTEKLVEKIVSAIKTNKKSVMAPFIVNFIPFLKGLLPQAVWDSLAFLLRVNTSMMGWRGHG